MRMSRRWIGVVLVCLMICGCKSASVPAGGAAAASRNDMQFVPTADLGEAGREDFPAVKLRGYGEVSGTLLRFDAAGWKASSLHIACENPEKAKVLHAKFISDLGLLPGVKAEKVATPAGEVSALAVEHQGYTLALVSGHDVLILSAPTRESLASLYAGSVKGDRAAIASEPQAQVPMFLDRFDRHGFRFYNYAYQTPQDQTEQTYDFTSEFEFAVKNGHSGPIVIPHVSAVDTAEGLMKDPWWDWIVLGAQQHNLPVGMNLNFGPQTWLANRYREQMAQKMPQYSGGYYRVASIGYPGELGLEGWISWSATTAQDEALADVQQVVRRYNDVDNITTWLEPHGELRHGDWDVFLEYGPVADATFRQFLKDKYPSLADLSKRWTGSDDHFKSWDDVKVPEVASFTGWGPRAIDLAGDWRVVHQTAVPVPTTAPNKPKTEYPPFDPKWFEPGFDDSKAVVVTAPGHDRIMFLPHRPAVYRQTFEIDPAWRKEHQRVYLYVWDLNCHLTGSLNDKTDVVIYLNGKEVSKTPIIHAAPHWVGVEVSKDLLAGKNDLAIGLPQGYLGYRVYLSPDAPAQYPNLGTQKNAQWADLTDWIAWTRVESQRRGIEMIRQVDPDRQIILMHPDDFSSGIKKLMEDYGGEFHNTGYMAGVWSDLLPMLAASSDFPSSVEPGGSAPNAKDFRLFLARWMTEGVQGIDYFISIGEVMWRPDVRAEFERTQNIVDLVGKYHFPKAQAAVFFSDRSVSLSGYPWGSDPNTELSRGYWQGGFWRWNVAELLVPLFPRDGVNDGDFHRNNVGKYKVIIDSNTSIIDDDLLKKIEEYVRGGGVFVTFVQTGRNTSTDFNAWPISKLTGYEVTHIDQHDGKGKATTTRKLSLAPGQNIFSPDYWKSAPSGNGLSLKKVAADSRDLMLWEDGSVAVGMRPLGKGCIIHVGAKFSDDRLSSGGQEPTTRLFSDILDHFKVDRVPATAKGVMLRHFLTNNGLYDLWMLANLTDKPVTTDMVWQSGWNPGHCIEVLTGKPFSISQNGSTSLLKGLVVEPGEVRAFLTPRGDFDDAARDWFALQRNWWRGTAKPIDPPLPPPQMKLARDITHDWKFQPIDAAATDITAMAKPDYDDSKWEPMRIGVWNFPNHPNVRHAMFRKKFVVPAEWAGGSVSLWLQSWSGTTFLDRGRVYLDGELVRDFNADGIAGNEFSGKLKPGSTHTLAVEIEGKGVINGSRGDCWLAYVPAPIAQTSLAGQWIASQDAMHFNKTLTLPGEWDAFTARRHVTIDPKLAADRNVILRIDTTAPIVGVILNGHYVRRHHHMVGTRFDLNITPWVRIGQENEFELVTYENPGKGVVKDISLRYYDPATYP